MTQALDIAGEKFGRLTVIRRVENGKGGKSQWLCKCDCGKVHVSVGSRIKNGKALSCGCIQRETARKVMTKHRLSEHKLYAVRKEIISRTSNPNNKRYADYGGRGIGVCGEWANKETGMKAFYDWAMQNGYKDGLSVDRIDNDGDYTPGNCRWVNNVVQSNNKRSNVVIEFEGKAQTAAEWARELGGNVSLIRDRIKLGWSIERALTTPPRKITKRDAV